MALLTPCFWTSGFQNCENAFLLFLATQFVVLFYGPSVCGTVLWQPQETNITVENMTKVCGWE